MKSRRTNFLVVLLACVRVSASARADSGSSALGLASAQVSSQPGQDDRPDWSKVRKWLEAAGHDERYAQLVRSGRLGHALDVLRDLESPLEDEGWHRRRADENAVPLHGAEDNTTADETDATQRNASMRHDAASAEDSAERHSGSHSEQHVTMLFLFVMLLCGVICKGLSSVVIYLPKVGFSKNDKNRKDGKFSSSLSMQRAIQPFKSFPFTVMLLIAGIVLGNHT